MHIKYDLTKENNIVQHKLMFISSISLTKVLNLNTLTFNCSATRRPAACETRNDKYTFNLKQKKENKIFAHIQSKYFCINTLNGDLPQYQRSFYVLFWKKKRNSLIKVERS